jgi:hypothetical protein
MSIVVFPRYPLVAAKLHRQWRDGNIGTVASVGGRMSDRAAGAAMKPIPCAGVAYQRAVAAALATTANACS